MPTQWIDQLTLRTIDADRKASVAIASIPLPAENAALVAFKGLASQVLPIAWRPGDHGPGLPRQALVMGMSSGEGLPDQLAVTRAEAAAIVIADAPVAAASGSGRGPAWESRILSEKKLGLTMREVNELVIAHHGRRLGVRMGIELNSGQFHWWEWLQVEQLWTGPICTAIRAAGYVVVEDIPEDETFDFERYNRSPWYHRQNWLFVEVYAQLFANGLVRVTARHVNNRFFDQGRDLEGFVPVIGFSGDGIAQADTPVDGSRTDFSLGAVQLDLDRGADLFSAEHPARIRSVDDVVIYQPYEGAEFLLGDGQPDDRWNVRAEQRRLWKGMARSFSFDLSFADQPIRTRRYLPPYGYQAWAGALWPDAALPGRGILEPACDKMLAEHKYGEWLGHKPMCSGRYYQPSCMWDGEYAHALMRHAYRTARRDAYDAAIHHAYAFADVGIDHADFTHQIVGMPKGSISLVLQRGIGMLAAYLETGDPYLLRMAESLADTAYAIDRSNWPRRSFGRDSAYIRTMTRLYDVTGQTHYLQRAGEACRRVTQCQRADGSYADQGGACGAHGHLNELVKAWMNSILAEVLVDYLERAGNDPVVERSLIRTADWLLSVLLEDKDGKYWAYQYAWGKNENDPTGRWQPDKPPNKHPAGQVQLDYNARTLLFVSQRTGDPKYARAWQATYQRTYVKLDKSSSTYGNVKVPDNFPWHEAHLWGARWEGGKVTLHPMLELIEVGREATIELPDGKTARVKRTTTGVEFM